MSLENSIERLTYRTSKETTRFAWRTVILSIVFGSAVFIIVPLTTSKPVKELKTLSIIEAPETTKIKLPEKEKIYEQKQAVKTEVEPEKIRPAAPSIPTPKVAQIPIKLSQVETEFKLDLKVKMNTDINFNVEKISVIDVAPKKPVVVKETPPVKALPARDYNAVFSDREVDSDATLLKRIDPVYPRTALRRNITGSVIISCVISKEGIITNPRIVRATPKGYFEDNCMEILDRMKYKPAMVDGRPVAQRMELTFDFGIQE